MYFSSATASIKDDIDIDSFNAIVKTFDYFLVIALVLLQLSNSNQY
jgi:hypothetical protein